MNIRDHFEAVLNYLEDMEPETFVEWECHNCDGIWGLDITPENIEAEEEIAYCPYCGMSYQPWDKREVT